MNVRNIKMNPFVRDFSNHTKDNPLHVPAIFLISDFIIKTPLFHYGNKMEAFLYIFVQRKIHLSFLFKLSG